MLNSYQTTTLKFNPAECNGCGMCIAVCPHAVFAPAVAGKAAGRNGRAVTLAHGENCMECGACQLNCPTNAIAVESGAGCATAMMIAAVTRRQQATCG